MVEPTVKADGQRMAFWLLVIAAVLMSAKAITDYMRDGHVDYLLAAACVLLLISVVLKVRALRT